LPSDVVLPDEMVSRQHATVWVQAGRLYIRDDGSTNGTWVNERRISAPTLLRPGDRVRLGQTVLEVVGRGPGATVVMPEVVSAPPPAPFPPAAPPSPPVAVPPQRRARSPLPWILAGIGALFLCGALIVGGLLAGRQGLLPIPFLATPTSTPTPTPIPGIGKPIQIDGIEVTFVRAEKRDRFTNFTGSVLRPASERDTFLIVDAETPLEQYDWDKVSEWSIVLNDDIEPSIIQGTDEGELTWVFVVRKSETSFILTLPGDATVDLSPILR
jgi:hypothetical protein